jgi:hypothetical protein
MMALLGLLTLAVAPPKLISFETDAEVSALKANNTRISPITKHATDGKRALSIEFLPAEWPNVTFVNATSWDCRNASSLTFDLTNPGTAPVSFYVRVDDDPKADGVQHCRTGNGTLAPGKTTTFVMPLGADPMALGMRGLPPTTQGFLSAQGSGLFDPGQIVAFQIFLRQPAAPVVLVVDNIRFTSSGLSLTGIVDKFGQYAKADWSGKLKQESEFAERRKAEEQELAQTPSLPDRDTYGGWASGPKLDATGWFRTAKHNGKWWLVTPDGHLFFSAGIDCVALFDTTITTGRETMFTWLPKKDEPLGQHIGSVTDVHSGPVKIGATFSFFTANLERKYGRDYQKNWFDLALKRLKSWGFNTVGNWSDWQLYSNRQVPYVATASIEGDHARLSSGSDYWAKMHYPFDPRFAESVTRSLREIIARVKDNPWCLGYFVDNELSWGGYDGDEKERYGLAYGALKAAATASPAKRAFLAQLKAKYAAVEKLNAAWGMRLTSWEAMQASFNPEGAPNAAMKSDMGAFIKSLAREYFRTIRDTLRKSDPHHLYLGCRFAWRTPEAVEAAVEFCDVIGFNIYQSRLEAAKWEFANSLNKPCIIGEFHFGALDRGLFHTGLVAAPDQKIRAQMYQDYLRSVLDHPAFVGCHWFQFSDEPLTGRTFDGENYNIGFLTVTDTPYPEMVVAARAVHREIYTRRADVKK